MRPYPRSTRQPSTVSVEVAQRLLDERDAFRAEVERLRLRNAELLAELDEVEPQATSPTAPVDEALIRRVEELTRDLTRVRQRTEVEVEEARVAERALQTASLGEVLDSVQRGLAMGPNGDSAAWRNGLLAIEAQLLAVFREVGASLNGEVGELYDPTLHQAVAMVANSELPAGRIAEVIRPGIVLADGRVARPAQVYVTK